MRRVNGNWADMFDNGEMDKMVANFLGINPMTSYGPANTEIKGLYGTIADTASIVVDKDYYVVRVDMPGCNKEEIKITVDGDCLKIRAARKKAYADDANVVVRPKRSSCTYTYELTFESPDFDDVSAEYNDGVLEVRVKKMTPVKPDVKTIAVK